LWRTDKELLDLKLISALQKYRKMEDIAQPSAPMLLLSGAYPGKCARISWKKFNEMVGVEVPVQRLVKPC
jgi:hypothetical protein